MGKKKWVQRGGQVASTAEIDSRGRITIPREFRERLQIRPGDEFRVEEEQGVLLLHRKTKATRKIRSSRNWGREAFLDAGEATFGGRQGPCRR